jgi:hypothetical protein
LEKGSENRDPREAAAKRAAQKLGLTGERGHYGPDEYIRLTPTREADDLAIRLAERSLGPLHRALIEEPEYVPDVEVWDVLDIDGAPAPRVRAARFRPTAERMSESADRLGLTFGIPLLCSLEPEALPVIAEILLRRFAPGLRPERDLRRELGMRTVVQEAHLWDMAAKHGGPSPTLPFATRVRALRWWWEPEQDQKPGQRKDPRATLCVRCGSLEIARALRHGAPVCAHCRKDRSLDRPEAIAPAERGTWWLRCQTPGCSNAFVGRAQARHCAKHRSSRIAPSQRLRH